MKLKGVNPLEQHLEKIVLCAVGAAFLIVLALQFLWEPNRVKVGTQMLPPGSAFDPLATKAGQIKGKMDETSPPQLEDAKAQLAKASVDLTDQFRKRMTTSAEVDPNAVAMGKPPQFDVPDIGPGGPGQATPIAPLVVPAPASVVASAYRGTIDPTETISHPEIKAMLPAEQPFDKAWVTAEARIDGAALKAALSSAPDGGKFRPIPRPWWTDSTAIFSVKLERQERGAGGDWADAVTVQAPPGGFDLTALLKGVVGTSDMDEAVSQVRAMGDAVVRPAFFHTIAGHEWSPPSEVAAAAAGDATPAGVEQSVKKIKSDRETKDRVQKQIDTAQQPPKTPGGGGGGGSGGGGGKGGASSSGSGQGTRGQEKDPKQETLKRLQDQLKKLDDSITKEEDKLRELGFDDTGKKVKTAPTPTGTPGSAAAEASKSIFDNGDLQVWAHDMTAEAGKTYRYRVSVGINNPAFGRGSVLVAEQQDLAKSALVYSEPSEWSAPVTVPSDRYYFITGTSEPNELGPAHASVELYQFFYGYYRKGTATLEPGDLVAAKLGLPDAAKLPIYDLAAVGKPVDPSAPPTPGAPAGSPPAGPSPFRGHIRGDPGRAQTVSATSPEKPKLPQNSKPFTGPLTASVDAMLLDVARPATASESNKAEAVLRIGDGSLESRDPDETRTNDIYRKLQLSAKEGENQPAPSGETPAAPVPTPVTAPPKAPTGPIRPPPPGGGGGGGGGG